MKWSSCLRTSELYASAPVREFLGPALRPGGGKLTLRMLELAGPSRGGLALDAGCGCGASLALLREHGAWAVGLDLNADFLQEARHVQARVARADLAALPLPAGCADLILCECVWNLTEKERVLEEFLRVLRPGGTLALADIYARGRRAGEWPVRCCFAQATDLPMVLEQVAGAGFEIDVVEDHTELLKKTAADFVFRHGSLYGFWQAVTGDPDLALAACEASRAARPGLFLLTAHVPLK